MSNYELRKYFARVTFSILVAKRMLMSFRPLPNAVPGDISSCLLLLISKSLHRSRACARCCMAVHAILVSQTFSENQRQRSGRTEPFRLSGLRTFCCIWCKALLQQHKNNWEGLSKQVSIMLLGMRNVAFLHRKQFESWCKSTCKLKNGWENCNQSYSFTDSCGISTRRNFFVRISCFAWNRRHSFFRLARCHASRRFCRFRHLNLSTVCTHSFPQFAGILRALCVICAEVCSLSVLLLPSMSNNFALSVRYKIILASGH